MSSLRNERLNQYISEHYPCAKVVDYLDASSGLSYYTTDELEEADRDWFPLCCYKNPADGKLVYGGRSDVYHTYVEGETGAGKTTRFAMQSIRPLLYKKEKPSLVIVDVHGELVENLASDLKKNQYRIKILNCDEPERSDTYNPLESIADECEETGEISYRTTERIRYLSEILQPVESTQDPIWDMGARSYANGCLLDKVEDLVKGDLPKECLTLYNLIQNHYWLRDSICRDGYMADLMRLPHYGKKGNDAPSVQKMISVTNNAEKTRASYFGVVENHYDQFGQPSMYALSSSSTINVEDFIERPMAIFIQCANTSVGDSLIGFLVNDIYTKMEELGKKSANKRAPRMVHCFLDEFANCTIADNKTFIKMLTTSRKFGMYWHLLVQCDAQIDKKYGQEDARTIRANCTEIFMGSNDYETLVRFARSCGKTTVETAMSHFSQQAPMLETVDLITAEELNLLEKGYAYVKVPRQCLLKSYYEAFYECDEFEAEASIDSIYPRNAYDYHTTRFVPDDIPEWLDEKEFAMLNHVLYYEATVQEIKQIFPKDRADELLRSLERKRILQVGNDGRITSLITPVQHSLICQRLDSEIYTLGKPYVDSLFEEDEAERTEPQAAEDTSPDLEETPSIDGSQSLESDFFDDESDWKAELERLLKDHLLQELRAHITMYHDDLRLNMLRKYSSVPQMIKNAFNDCMANPDTNFACVAEEWPINPHVLKYEILEAYIGANDYATKTEWENELRKEYRAMKRQHALPACLLEHFSRTLEELEQSLTLSEIKEIKSIINS